MERQKRVIIFSTPTCSHCVKAKRYLKDKGIRFKDIDVSRDMKAAQDMERRTGQRGVPVLLIDNKPVVGFDVSKINRLLDIV
ncbi:glutaredoxin family protein [bacterium]|nr:glutaredoxin family protein [bacterium]